jgi:hypothetical protein
MRTWVLGLAVLYQRRFDAIAREMFRGSSDVCYLLLDCDLRIRAASRAYECVTLRDHGELPGQLLFDAFPDNPDDPQASGTSHLGASLETAMRSGHAHNMRIQRYDIRDPAAPDEFLPRVWSPTNSPLLDHGELVGVVHCVEEISDSQRMFGELARAVDQSEAWTPAELLHTFAGISAVEKSRHREHQQALVAEIEQLGRAIESRDMIGQAKGMLMERFDIAAPAAFKLLSKISQDTNTRVEQIARKLVALGRSPLSS